MPMGYVETEMFNLLLHRIDYPGRRLIQGILFSSGQNILTNKRCDWVKYSFYHETKKIYNSSDPPPPHPPVIFFSLYRLSDFF